MGSFKHLVVPIELRESHDPENPGNALQTGAGQWIALGPLTIEALRLAAELADGGTICLVHATPDLAATAMYAGADAAWISPRQMDEAETAAVEQALRVLNGAASRYCSGAKIEFTIKAGQPLQVILDAARFHDADAIVLAASGRNILQRALMGSVADKVVREAPCPVIVIPNRER
ncbi:MAG: universal stress protein [Nannocystaceae bacterium]|nr:universal stress protein [bacterium]